MEWGIMVGINIYKIDSDKSVPFYQNLCSNMKRVGETRSFKRVNERNMTVNYTCTLYTSIPSKDKELSWNWVLEEFNQEKKCIPPAPRGIVVFQDEDNTLYAITFGNAFFLVDKFCDRDFGFRFARKLEYDNIKTTTLTTPDSHRNKTVNTYIDYNELEFDSGESFAKLKAKVKLPDNFTLYKASIEVGTSIRFSTSNNTLDGLLDLILHIEHVISHEADKCNIPMFTKVKDADKITRLDEELNKAILSNATQINFSELEIIGATEIFNHNDCEYLFKYQGKQYRTSALTNEELKSFCANNQLDYGPLMLNATVTVLNDNTPVRSHRIKELIDYTNDSELCLLSKGVWYQYNQDYLTYLRDSINEIEVRYDPKFDFSEQIYNEFINQQYILEYTNNNIDCKIANKESIIKSLKHKYYTERAFNIICSKSGDFINFDRNTNTIGTAKVEPMDLYQKKEHTICAVKFGNVSSKLCYAIDQSLAALKLCKQNQIHVNDTSLTVTSVALWFILERQTHIEDEKGRPQLDELDMLMLKNRLDQWKKEVRLRGYKPLVYINYRK